MARMLSIGLPSTLGVWHRLCVATFGGDAEPTKYVKSLLDEQGEDEEVIADEGQFLMLLVSMNSKPETPGTQ